MSSPIHNKNAAQLEPRLDRWLAPVRDSESLLDQASHEATAKTQERRAAHIDKLSTLIRSVPAERVRMRRRSQWLWSLSAAAALVVAVVGSMLTQSPTFSESPAVVASSEAQLRQFFGQVVARREAGTTEILKPGSALYGGDEVSTTAEAYASLDVGRARIDMASATTVQLLRTGRNDQAYELRAGRIDVSIPKVPGEYQRLAVVTPDTTVRVLGTVFSVEVGNVSGESVTRVQVTRGSVAVEHGGSSYILEAGERWTSEPPVLAVDSPDEEEPVQRVVEAPVRGATSNLAEQNQLFARALGAQRSGNAKLAAQLYNRFLKRYPDSPLGPTARAELAEVKRQLLDSAGSTSK